ncbi:hypothetical protein PsorP6_011234 [Peronosclerospora sorghi]|uniref:Uncharacterized protein n=1 Tax=Peronosclerospora sorghi TaxID=230839 RepID=A0ACC0VVP4_9STRA|nr:hypothetical protein PsorP6_011234 [Peronosclerospora sorghi]
MHFEKNSVEFGFGPCACDYFQLALAAFLSAFYMALYRKQRGNEDASPQYVRITKSRSISRALSFHLRENHVHAKRVYAKHFAAADRSRKISSLQLRACFMLCVLLYFAAIYFADDIVSIGRVVSSEQSTHTFFTHSMRSRTRGNVRMERATNAEKMVNTDKSEQNDELQHLGLHEVQLQLHKTKNEAKVTVAEAQTAQETEPFQQPDSEAMVLRQNGKDVQDIAVKNAVDTGARVVSIPAALEDGKSTTIPGNETRSAEKSGTGTYVATSTMITISKKIEMDSTTPQPRRKNKQYDTSHRHQPMRRTIETR